MCLAKWTRFSELLVGQRKRNAFPCFMIPWDGAHWIRLPLTPLLSPPTTYIRYDMHVLPATYPIVAVRVSIVHNMYTSIACDSKFSYSNRLSQNAWRPLLQSLAKCFCFVYTNAYDDGTMWYQLVDSFTHIQSVQSIIICHIHTNTISYTIYA